MGLGGLSSLKLKYSPPQTFFLLLCFLLDLSQESNTFFIIFDQWKEPAAGRIFVFASNILAQTLAEINPRAPPKPKILTTSLLHTGCIQSIAHCFSDKTSITNNDIGYVHHASLVQCSCNKSKKLTAFMY